MVLVVVMMLLTVVMVLVSRDGAAGGGDVARVEELLAYVKHKGWPKLIRSFATLLAM